MSLVEGCGCWSGQASGRVVWLDGAPRIDGATVVDRLAEVNRFRVAIRSALAALERWADEQTTLEGRLWAQSYQEALGNQDWSRRTVGLIDRAGLPARAAALRAAETLASLMARNAGQAEQGQHLVVAAEALGEWLEPRGLDNDAVVAAKNLSTLALLAVGRPALLAGVEAPVGVGSGPVVWGVPGLNPDWHGCRVRIDDCRVDLSAAETWLLFDDRLNDLPIWRMDGKPGDGPTIGASAALVNRLDDLAAVPLVAATVGAIAVDLGALGHTTSIDHPGTLRLLQAAAEAAHSAGIPFLAGGCVCDRWSELGFTGSYRSAHREEGSGSHAL